MTNEILKEHNYTIESKENLLVVKNKKNKSDIEMEVILFNSDIITKIKDYEDKRELDQDKHYSLINKIIELVKEKFN